MAKKKKKPKKQIGSTIGLILTLAAIAAVVLVCSKAVFKCDHCNMLSFGGGYKPNILIETFGDEKRVCENCAKEEHKEMLGLGLKSLRDFEIEIQWFGKAEKEEAEQK